MLVTCIIFCIFCLKCFPTPTLEPRPSRPNTDLTKKTIRLRLGRNNPLPDILDGYAKTYILQCNYCIFKLFYKNYLIICCLSLAVIGSDMPSPPLPSPPPEMFNHS